jgi:hypothetical protein
MFAGFGKIIILITMFLSRKADSSARLNCTVLTYKISRLLSQASGSTKPKLSYEIKKESTVEPSYTYMVS